MQATPNSLETERLILRPLAASDVEALVELDRDPEVMRWLTGGKPIPAQVYRDTLIPRWMAHDTSNSAFGHWIVVEKATGDFLGWVHLDASSESQPDAADLGYRLRRAAWGKGYATEASRALIDLAFRDAGLKQVTATTYGENVGSRRVMEKLGMRLVRTYRMTVEELKFHNAYDADNPDLWPGDDVEYAITREEWEQQ
jgi:RimJ/RimL family protein N-acetyltransferase